MDNLCRFCGIQSAILVKNDKLIDDLELFLPFKIKDNVQLHSALCLSCEDKLKNWSSFLKLMIEAQIKLEKLVLAQRINSDTNLNILKEKFSKLPNLRIQKIIKSPKLKIKQETMDVTTLSSNKSQEISDLITKLRNKKNVTVSKISSQKLNTNEYSDIEILDDVSVIEQDTEIYDVDEIDHHMDTSSEETQKNVDMSEPPDIDVKEYLTNKLSNEKVKTVSSKSKNQKASKVTIVQMDQPAAYVCMTCKEKFLSFELLKEHMINNQKCKTVHLTCDRCSKICETKKALYQHSLSHREKNTHICDECGKAYSNRFNLENHKSSFHGEKVEEFGSIYKCKVCEKQFTNRKDLYEHINSHSKEHSVHLCDACGKCFSSSDNLKSHQKVHMNIKPFACLRCDARFRFRLQLSQHLHVHTGVKKYSCDTCGKTFAKRESLLIHLRIHTGEMPFKCNICLEKFRSVYQLKTHFKVHFDIEVKLESE